MFNIDDTALRGGTMCLENPAIGIDGSASADAETGADFDYAIDGQIYTCTSDDGDIQLDDNTVTAGYTALFLCCIDSAGTITVVKSDEVDNDDLAAGNAVIHWPTPTANTCPFGAIKVKNATASVFTGGTTGLDTSDITDTYYNLLAVPTAPLTS